MPWWCWLIVAFGSLGTIGFFCLLGYLVYVASEMFRSI